VAADDAIVLAANGSTPCSPARNGDKPLIGLNVRLAPYAGVSDDQLKALCGSVVAAARHYGATLSIVPISRSGAWDDAASTRRLLSSLLNDVVLADDGTNVTTPAAAIAAAARCRIVVTGSYHAAVFALSRGVPVTALAANDYYAAKFDGLAEQFGGGITTVRLDGYSFESRMASAVDAAWMSSAAERARWIDAARRQADSCRAVYARLFELVERRRPAAA
jgi:colanic acid/amylovoran biosynthesis protein